MLVVVVVVITNNREQIGAGDKKCQMEVFNMALETRSHRTLGPIRVQFVDGSSCGSSWTNWTTTERW